jgi:hypothetical protein
MAALARRVEAVMIGHFSADILLSMIGPDFRKPIDRGEALSPNPPERE